MNGKRTIFSALTNWRLLDGLHARLAAGRSPFQVVETSVRRHGASSEFFQVPCVCAPKFAQSNPDTDTSASNEKSACAHVKD